MKPPVRVGQGFDVHPLCAGDGLMLGGLSIPCDVAVEADSDGDVLLHALADAMLGAAGLGDIGELYPPGGEAGRGLAGSDLIAAVRGRLAERQLAVAQADLTLICEYPKLAPHREPIRRSLAQLLAIGDDCVGVKATTTDGLGFAGRREGIAALAVVLLMPVAA